MSFTKHVLIGLLCITLLYAFSAGASSPSLPAPELECQLDYFHRTTPSKSKKGVPQTAVVDEALDLHNSGYSLSAVLSKVQPPDFPAIWYEVRIDLNQGTTRSGTQREYTLDQITTPDFKDPIKVYLGDEESIATVHCTVRSK